MKPYMISISLDGQTHVFGVFGDNPTDAINRIDYISESTYQVIEIIELKPTCALSINLN